MSTETESLTISLFGEILAADQIVRNSLSRVLPKGMELSHFSVLNHLSWHEGERSPAQLAKDIQCHARCYDQYFGKIGMGGVYSRPP